MRPLKALFFDQDGVIADTERDGHRVAFNRVFNEYDLGFEWSVEEYGALLTIGGGRERLLHYLDAEEIGNPESRTKIAKMLHARKTSVFVTMIENGEIPARPGVRRLMTEAKSRGLIVGVCTTSQERAAHAICDVLLPGVGLDFILAGDVVSRKKPDPEIYRLALKTASCEADESLVIEDSRQGVTAARQAGIPVIATVNDYTRDHDLTAAELVLTSLGDTGSPATVLAARRVTYSISDLVTIDDLSRIHAASISEIENKET